MVEGRTIIAIIGERQDIGQFRRKNWTGTFEEYLEIVRKDPKVSRTAFERTYDMFVRVARTMKGTVKTIVYVAVFLMTPPTQVRTPFLAWIIPYSS